MTLMLRLIREHDIGPDQIVAINVGTNKYMPNALKHPRPTNELEAKFSMQFCLAILALDRKGGIAEFTDAATRRPDVRAMIEKVNFYVHDELEALGYDQMWTQLDIKIADGRTVRGRTRVGRGHPEDPMSDQELTDKFRECAGNLLVFSQVDRAIEIVFDLDRGGRIDDLMSAVTPA